MRILRNHAIKTIKTIFLSLSFFLILQNVSFAGIAVEPTIIEMVLESEGSNAGVYTIRNEGDAGVSIKVEIEDWLALKTGVAGIPLSDWLKVEPMEFDLGPKEEKQVNYTVNIPKDYNKEVVAMVFFGTTEKYEGDYSITSRIGASIYAVRTGNINLDCSIKNMEIRRQEMKDEAGNVTGIPTIFNFDIENTGNVHLRPTGNLIISQADNTTYDIDVPRDFAIYPGLDVWYAVRWDKMDIAPGKYRGDLKLNYGNMYNITKIIEKSFEFEVKKDGTVALIKQ